MPYCMCNYCYIYSLQLYLLFLYIILGFLAGMHNAGKLMMAIPMSQLTEKYKHRHTLFVTTLLLVIGSLLWAFCPILGGIAMLYIAQLVLGASCGCLGPARGFISEQTRPDRRTYVLGRLSALEYAGHYVTPIFGALLIALGATMTDKFKFAFPALILAMCGMYAIYLLYYYFEDIKPEDVLTEDDFNPVIEQKTITSTTPTITYTYQNNKNNQKSNDIEEQVSEIYTPPPTSPDATTPNSVQEPISSPTVITISSTEPIVPVNNNNNIQENKEKQREKVFLLIMFVNFAVRACMVVYTMLTAQIILNHFNLSYYALGGIISGAGNIGHFVYIYVFMYSVCMHAYIYIYICVYKYACV